MTNKLVSLIVAVYNGEKYIADCLESIRNQTYSNFEVLLIDDGSTDSSGLICDEFTQNDKRFKVVHQENRGCSAARNTGLNLASGDFLGIIDQDDYLHEKYIEYFLTLLEENNADIATTDTIQPFIGDAPKTSSLDLDNYSVWSGWDSAKAMLMYTLQIGPWNKLISRDLIIKNSIEFQEQFYCGEGFAFSVECFQETDKVVVGHENVYFYRIDNATSGSSTYSSKKCQSSLNAQEYMRNILKDKSSYADKVLKFSKWRTASDYFTLLQANHVENQYPEEYKMLKKISKKYALTAFGIPTKLKQKIRAVLFFISPKLAAKCFSKYLNKKMGGKFDNIAAQKRNM